MSKTIRWGIISTGRIAGAFADGLPTSNTGSLAAVASRSVDSARRFIKEHGGASGGASGGDNAGKIAAHGSYDDLLADENVEAVYIATPHPMHAEWAVKAAEAGKHVLCEKPFTLNHADAMAVIDAARRHDVFLMEAFMYRCNPQTHKIVELIRSGAIGQVRAMHGSFAYNAGPTPEKARVGDPALGGGGILDVGTYPVSLARLIAGVAVGKPFDDPIDVRGAGKIDDRRIDQWAAAVLRFAGGITATVATAIAVGMDNTFQVFGSEGDLFVPQPWFATRGGRSTLTIRMSGTEDRQQIVIEEPRDIYGVEADTVAEFIDQRQASSPAMSWADTLGNMKTLDRWRKDVGVVYPEEQLDEAKHTIARRPLRKREGAPMKYGRIAGLDADLSRLACGADWGGGDPLNAWRVFDAYFEAGGNLFDTGHLYADGDSDRNLGRWVRHRGVERQVRVLAKGIHTPNNFPDKIGPQLIESLDRMGLNHATLYVMHRDNPDVPAGEFIDALNEQVKLGRCTIFGGSNWSIPRMKEANAYAKQHGLQGPSVLSNNLSLARMVNPVWAGCVAASDPGSRAWLEETQTALIPWSSQARGFFTGRSGPNMKDDPELVRCWYSDDNFQRKARAVELAQNRGVEPIAIALAYVLSQPFPTFPLIGPRTIGELTGSLAALSVELSADDAAYLNLETS